MESVARDPRGHDLLLDFRGDVPDVQEQLALAARQLYNLRSVHAYSVSLLGLPDQLRLEACSERHDALHDVIAGWASGPDHAGGQPIEPRKAVPMDMEAMENIIQQGKEGRIALLGLGE